MPAAIGGVREVVGWDGIDIVLAHKNAYRTESFNDLVARHHRPTGPPKAGSTATWAGAAAQYIQGPAYWVLARTVNVGAAEPRVLPGFAYVAGYAQAALKRMPRFDEGGYRAHLRGELRGRAAAKLRSPKTGVGGFVT